MFKNIVFLFSLSLAGACAGTPPAWWNPSGAYGEASAARQQNAVVKPSLAAPTAQEEEEPYPVEQTIEPVMESYEELDLSPFAQTVEVSAQPEAEQPQPAASQREATASQPRGTQYVPSNEAAPQESFPEFTEEENLPDDGSLPFPSVLQ